VSRCRIAGCTPEEIKIGMRVEAYFEDINDEAAILKIKPVT
jgi:uncharacterized OB-fold protein